MTTFKTCEKRGKTFERKSDVSRNEFNKRRLKEYYVTYVKI